MSVGKLLTNISRYLMIISVYLVPHQHPQHLGRGVLLYLAEPVWTTVEGWLIGHIVDQDESMGRAVVGLGDTAKPV